MRWATLLVLVCLSVGCHRRALGVGDVIAQVHAMEQAVIERTLRAAFPDEEGWILLPGMLACPIPELSSWWHAYRVVAPDSLPADAWSRCATVGEPVEILEVWGSRTVPQRSSPGGFRGVMVRFLVRGVPAEAMIVDPPGMRWVAWFEQAAILHADEGVDLDSLGMEAFVSVRQGAPMPPCGFRGQGAHPVARVAAGEIWAALEASARGLPHPGGRLETDVTAGRRLIFGAPQDPLENDEPCMLHERLASVGDRRMVISPRTPLPPGHYLWAVSTLGQARAVRLDEIPPEAPVGPSAIFYGRPVRAAGGLVIREEECEAHVFCGEYGLSPASGHSLALARDAARKLWPRIGHLLAALPGPEQGARWPSVRLLPPSPPAWWTRPWWGHWEDPSSRIEAGRQEPMGAILGGSEPGVLTMEAPERSLEDFVVHL